MHRRTALALAIAALACWPAEAAAKGVPTSVSLCGPAACVTLRSDTVRMALERSTERGGAASPRLAPFVRLTTRPAIFDLRGFLIPGQGIVVMNGSAHQLGPRAAGLIRARLAAIAPYRPRITGVWVAGHAAVHPGAYASMLRRPGVAMPASVWNHHSVLIAIALAGQTPWSDWGSALYFPALRLLHVPDGAWVHVTAAQASVIAAGRRPSRPAPGSIGTAAIALTAAMAAVALAIVAVTQRRRRPQAV
jgi:hypothetical protein